MPEATPERHKILAYRQQMKQKVEEEAYIFSSLLLFYVFVFMHMQISLSIETASNVPTRDVLGLSETV